MRISLGAAANSDRGILFCTDWSSCRLRQIIQPRHSICIRHDRLAPDFAQPKPAFLNFLICLRPAYSGPGTELVDGKSAAMGGQFICSKYMCHSLFSAGYAPGAPPGSRPVRRQPRLATTVRYSHRKNAGDGVQGYMFSQMLHPRIN